MEVTGKQQPRRNPHSNDVEMVTKGILAESSAAVGRVIWTANSREPDFHSRDFAAVRRHAFVFFSIYSKMRKGIYVNARTAWPREE